MVEVYPWFIGEVPVGDAMKRLKGDVYNWWLVKRVWQTEQRTPRHASADRLEGVLYSSSHWSLAAFRELVDAAETPAERMDVVETYFEHVALDRDVGGETRAWLTNFARDEPELYRMICLSDDDLSLYPRCRSSRWGDMLCCDQI